MEILDNIIPNTQIPFIGEYVRLVGAICNKYCRPLCTDNPSDELLGLRMLHLSKQNNALMLRVENEGLDRLKTIWKNVDESSIMEFPKLDQEDLRSLTLGVYQLKLAKSYTHEHMKEDGKYDLLVHRQTESLLMAKIQTRHTSGKSYKMWIEYDECSLTGWFCQCRAGSRVVGTCAHIAAVVWFLGFARYQGVSFCSCQSDWTLYLADAQNLPEPELIDDESEEFEE